ncbi:MAG: hypothetical protein JXK05_06460 [Campylobacterales bacterium]|nr:hypothetical protein [Campylobacterales bacterium]
MSTLMKIEEEIKKLPEKDYIALRAWFLDYESKKWDAQIEKDGQNGTLDDLATQAIMDFKSGKYRSV